MEATYLPWRYEFALFATRNYKNYGIRATSRTESSHAELKRYLKNRLADLRRLYSAIEMMMTQKIKRYEVQLAKEKSERLPKYTRIALLNPLCLRVSSKALELIHQQFNQANDYYIGRLQRRDLPPCTRGFRRQYGLPCRHEILERLDAVTPLKVEDCDRHWWISLADENPDLLRHLQEPDPDVVPPRGRPKNGPVTSQDNRRDTTTRRQLSHDEVRGAGGRIGLQGSIQRPREGGRGGRGGRGRAGCRGGRNTLTNRVANMEAAFQRLAEALEQRQ